MRLLQRVARRGQPMTGDDVRLALVRSQRWTALIAPFPILVLAALPPMDPDAWSAADRLHAVAWACDARTKTPAPISEYVESLTIEKARHAGPR